MPKKPAKKKPAARPETTVLGDIHGDLDALHEVLGSAGLIDGDGHWNGGKHRLVQVGDLIDRGPKSVETFEYLLALKEEARQARGDVSLLIGNHELALLEGLLQFTRIDPQRLMSLISGLREGIIEGDLHAACFSDGYLITHAGLHPEILKACEFSPKIQADPEKIAATLNIILRVSVESGDFSHPIFNVGTARGGPHGTGGIFWEDARHLFESGGIDGIKQVFGHTPCKYIASSDDRRLTNIDVGLAEYYGGGRAYVRIRGGNLKFTQMAKRC